MGKYHVLLESPSTLAAFHERFGILEDVHVRLQKGGDNLEGGLDYTCMSLVTTTNRIESSISGLAKRISDPIIDLTNPSMDVEVDDLASTHARRSSRTAKTTTPTSIKMKRKLQKDTKLLKLKLEVGATISAVGAITTGVGSSAGESITLESLKSKGFTLLTTVVVADPKDPAVKRPKTQGRSKTVSYKVLEDQFEP
ncbi:hypothetical protein CsSME_00045732 [Camellia sinensis var. sinensis]